MKRSLPCVGHVSCLQFSGAAATALLCTGGFWQPQVVLGVSDNYSNFIRPYTCRINDAVENMFVLLVGIVVVVQIDRASRARAQGDTFHTH